jgi:hypothetical protein
MMHSSKLALLLIATGIFIPPVSTPFADGYRRNAGLIENIQSMSVPVMPDRYRPELRPFLTDTEVGLNSESDQKKNSMAPPKADNYQTISYGDSGKNVLFDKSTSDEEMKKVLKAGKHQIEESTSKNFIFFGWTLSRHGLSLPFSFIVSGSLLLAFAGVVMLIFVPRRA